MVCKEKVQNSFTFCLEQKAWEGRESLVSVVVALQAYSALKGF